MKIAKRLVFSTLRSLTAASFLPVIENPRFDLFTPIIITKINRLKKKKLARVNAPLFEVLLLLFHKYRTIQVAFALKAFFFPLGQTFCGDFVNGTMEDFVFPFCKSGYKTRDEG